MLRADKTAIGGERNILANPRFTPLSADCLDRSAETLVLRAVVLLAMSLLVTTSLWSQSSTSALTRYTTAVQLSDAAKRVAAMEEFLLANPASSLAGDAVEIATWDSMRLADRARCSRWAGELLKRSPESPLAQAALAMNSPPQSAEGIVTLRNALGTLGRTHEPDGS